MSDTLLVIGSGTMGAGIAQAAASAGYRTLLYDSVPGQVQPGIERVEVIRGLETSDEAVRRTVEVAKRMGKEPVEINEFPGFAASRINALIGNEAFYMLMEGVASARDIDKALKLGLNHPMGPFELGDVVGWDVRLKEIEDLHEYLGQKHRPGL